MSNESNEPKKLRVENARLIALLESNGIDWRHPPAPTTASAPPTRAIQNGVGGGGLPIGSCQRSTGNWLVTRVERSA